MAENVDVEEGRRLLAEVREARNGIDGDRVVDALEAWQNWAFVNADALLSAASPPVEGGQREEGEFGWVTEIITIDAIDKGPVEATMQNPGWKLLHVGMGSGGQTTLTFGWPAPTPADPEEGEK